MNLKTKFQNLLINNNENTYTQFLRSIFVGGIDIFVGLGLLFKIY